MEVNSDLATRLILAAHWTNVYTNAALQQSPATARNMLTTTVAVSLPPLQVILLFGAAADSFYAHRFTHLADTAQLRCAHDLIISTPFASEDLPVCRPCLRQPTSSASSARFRRVRRSPYL